MPREQEGDLEDARCPQRDWARLNHTITNNTHLKRKLLLLALQVVIGLPTHAQTYPPKLAAQARFDLLASTNVGSLTNGYMLTGSADVARQTWLDAGSQQRSYTVNFSIVHYTWTEVVFGFTPASNGSVTLTVLGPWELSTNGNIYRQEVLWDNCTSTNATLLNGSFETVSGGVPTGWFRSYGDGAVDTGPVAPVAGTRYARVWANGPFDQTFTVSGGVPVSLHFFARAQVPTNFTETARLGTNTPAHEAALKFMRGVNLGNWLDAPPGQDWGGHYTTNDFTYIRNEGFDHVRLPIAWHYYTGAAPNYTLANNIFSNADFLVTNALNRGLGVIVDIHNYDAFATNTYSVTNQFYAIWRQIAAHYSNSPPQLAFELDNEPNGFATTQILNPIYTEAIRQIRLSNPNRVIFVGPSQWNSISELVNLLLPATDSNLVVTVHNYDPFLFTHQGATWPGPDTATTGVLYPGPPLTPLSPAPGVASWVTNWIADYNTLPTAANPSSSNAFSGKLLLARQWADYYGRPVHIGEFGAYINFADTNSRARFYAEFRGTADALGLGWATWDWKVLFRYWNDATLQPVPGLRDAMFPPFKLASNGVGQFSFDSALAKTFVIQRALNLNNSDWTAIQTQALTQPKLIFADSDTNQNTSAFYRVFWNK